jgi:outer membrane receptor protein involved in Fe transport
MRIAGGALQDKFQYSLGLAHMNVSGGVDGIEHVRDSTGQGYGLWRPNSTSSLSGRWWSTLSTVGVALSPAAGPSANLPATGTITAIPLAHSQMLLADRNLAYSTGNATFIPNVYDPDSRRVGDFHSGLVQWNQQVSPRWSYRASYQALASERDYRDGPAGGGYQASYNSSSLYTGRADTAQGRVDGTLARWNVLSFGYEWERESFQNRSKDENPYGATDATARGTQRTQAVFFQDQLRFFSDRLQVAASGRFQNFKLNAPTFEGGASVYQNATLSNTPNAFTGDVAVSYFFPKAQTKLRAHAGNGFRSPTLYERIGSYFYWGSFTALGDPALRPERTVSFDFGFDHYFSNSRYRVSSSYFYTRLQEVIGYANLTNDVYGRWGGYVNTGGALARGVEISAEARPVRRLIVQTSYTYTNADERNSALIGGTLSSIRIFPHSFSTIASYELTRRLTVSSSFLAASDYISGSFFVGSGNRPYLFAGPRKWDSAATYTLPLGERRSLRFHVKAENLLNREYYEDGFRTPGRWASAGVKFLF